VGTDDVSCSFAAATATFNNKNVGTNKTVTGSGFTLTGADKGNYVIDTVNTTTADITQAALDIYAVTDTKVYDGTTSSDETPTVSGLQGSDTVTGLVQEFQSKNVLGPGASTLEVTAYTVNDGNAGGNYDVTLHTASGTITPRPISIKADDQTKTYGDVSGPDALAPPARRRHVLRQVELDLIACVLWRKQQERHDLHESEHLQSRRSRDHKHRRQRHAPRRRVRRRHQWRHHWVHRLVVQEQ
jgi:hypothetical protein